MNINTGKKENWWQGEEQRTTGLPSTQQCIHDVLLEEKDRLGVDFQQHKEWEPLDSESHTVFAARALPGATLKTQTRHQGICTEITQPSCCIFWNKLLYAVSSWEYFESPREFVSHFGQPLFRQLGSSLFPYGHHVDGKLRTSNQHVTLQLSFWTLVSFMSQSPEQPEQKVCTTALDNFEANA